MNLAGILIWQLKTAMDELDKIMWQFAAKLTRSLPAELAHNLTIQALRLGLAPVADQLLLPTKIAGLGI